MKIKLQPRKKVKITDTKVFFSLGLTLTKNYQSFRVDAGIEMPVKTSPEKTYQEAQKLVENQIEIAVRENKELLSKIETIVE